MPLASGSTLGPYRIVGPIGAGGMGEVYRATDTRLDRTVAIKVLPSRLAASAELRERFEREARAVASLSHPNICTLHDIGRENGVDFMVMEYVEGETLADRLGRGRLPLREALERAVEIADALAKAHRLGVVHRDLKPSNVIVTKTGCKLLDFGLAKLSSGADDGAVDPSGLTAPKPLTERGVVLGTPLYMAPEQLEGKDVDARADVFAFGAVLYEMVTGRRAFGGESRASLIAAILTSEPVPPSALVPVAPRLLDETIHKCLAKDPEKRWQSMADVAHLLRIALARASDAGESRRAVSARPSRWARAAAAGLVVVGSAVLAVSLSRIDAPSAPAVRFAVAAPDGTLIEPRIDDAVVLAFSPDGRRLVFEAKTADGVDRLFLRPLDAVEARALEGTDGGKYPFFSPDGRFVAFFADGALKKLDVETGRVETLCDAVDGKGGTWSSEGVILFSPRFEAPLMRVSAAGGRARPETSLGPDVSGHYFPTFLPDGRRYLFQEIAETGSGIFMGSLDGTEAKRVFAFSSVSNFTSVAYARGRLFFVRDRSLVAQAFDPDGGTLSGEAVPVAEAIARIPPGWASFAIAPSGALAYVRDAGPPRTELLLLDRTGRPLGSAAPPGRYGFVALSPDGARLAVIDWDGSWSVWLVDRRRGTSTLAPGQTERHAFHVVWSPDGSRIAFGLDRDGPPNLFLARASGAGGAELLFRTRLQTEPTDWSPDGRFVLFQQNRRETGWDIGLVPVEPTDGVRTPRMLLETPFLEAEAHLSPDGTSLAYVSNESGRNEVYVVRFPGLDHKQRISVGGGHHPRWRRDGSELFFLAPGGRLMAAAVTTAPSFEAAVPHVLFERADLADVHGDLAWGAPYDVTPDGSRIVVNVLAEERASQRITVVLNAVAEP